MTRKCVKIAVAKKKIVFDGNSISDAYNWNKTYTYENGKGKKPIDFRVIISVKVTVYTEKQISSEKWFPDGQQCFPYFFYHLKARHNIIGLQSELIQMYMLSSLNVSPILKNI